LKQWDIRLQIAELKFIRQHDTVYYTTEDVMIILEELKVDPDEKK
jgi:hypothetical protein